MPIEIKYAVSRSIFKQAARFLFVPAPVPNGQLAFGMAVLTKPFPVETMAARIRSMIKAGKEQQVPRVQKA